MHVVCVLVQYPCGKQWTSGVMTRFLDDINPTDPYTDLTNHTHTDHMTRSDLTNHTLKNSSHLLHQNTSLNSSHLLTNQTTLTDTATLAIFNSSWDERDPSGSDITDVNEDRRVVGGQLQGQGGSPWQVMDDRIKTI